MIIIYLLFLFFVFSLLFSILKGLFSNPFVPTPKKTIELLLKKIELSGEDIVYDLGSGDGRVVFMLAGKNIKKAVGIENSFYLYLYSKIKRMFSKDKDKVIFLYKDLYKTDLSECTIVFCYILPLFLNKLNDKFKNELRSGTRIISYTFIVNEFNLIQTIEIGKRSIYIYRV